VSVPPPRRREFNMMMRAVRAELAMARRMPEVIPA